MAYFLFLRVNFSNGNPKWCFKDICTVIWRRGCTNISSDIIWKYGFKSKIAFKYTSTSTITPGRTFSSASQGYIFDIHPISYITEEEIKSYRAIKFMTSAKYTVVITQTAANSSNFATAVIKLGRLISNDTPPCLVSDFTGYFRAVGTASGPPFYSTGTYTQDLTTIDSNTYLKSLVHIISLCYMLMVKQHSIPIHLLVYILK